ncbi:hypothetical protein B1745_00120 [Lactobacillus amylolyticus]|uniref:hypothetical protein n=1 Tax=Lactobacillus amylolyticus TaxID=83683 RepID=UPI0009BA4442|nr:hypothetical protein [Lactobacillus amylolyticus]ARD06164.1 hypothetical protein B1745_00120 [Lactobacillus amylolyticus]
MYSYKEIAGQTYLNLKDGTTFFNIQKVITMINFPYSAKDSKNNVNSSILTKLNINILKIPTQYIEFAYKDHVTPKDINSYTQKNIEVISSKELPRLLKYIKKVAPTKNGTIKTIKYKEVSPGIIETLPVNNREPRLYWNLTNTLNFIHGLTTNSYYIGLSKDTLIKRANKLVKDKPKIYKKITVNSNQIDFENLKIHPNKKENYIILELHDELIDYYVSKTINADQINLKYNDIDILNKNWHSISCYLKNSPNVKEAEKQKLEVAQKQLNPSQEISIPIFVLETIDKNYRNFKNRMISLFNFKLDKKEAAYLHVLNDNNKEFEARQKVIKLINNYYEASLKKSPKNQLLIDTLSTYKHIIENTLNIY